MLTDEDLAAIARLLEAYGLEKQPSAGARRMRRLRERHKASQAKEQKRHAPKAKASQSVTSQVNGKETWDAYAKSYFERYGAEPTRNAKANSLISQFCKRVPNDEAPHIAAFFVRHQKGVYVSSHHALTLLLRDAEGLRTEWATNRPLTESQARQTDKTAGIGNVFLDLIEENRETKQ